METSEWSTAKDVKCVGCGHARWLHSSVHNDCIKIGALDTKCSCKRFVLTEFDAILEELAI